MSKPPPFAPAKPVADERARLLETALRAAKFEAQHQGPFNWSGTEFKERRGG